MADNKSKSWWALTAHVNRVAFVYFVTAFLINAQMALAFAFVNWVLHFATDAITSRLTSRAWARGQVHKFFTVIGADQWLFHAPALLITTRYILGVTL